MHKLLDTPNSDAINSGAEYTTRLVELVNVDARVVFPYVLAILESADLGAAQVVDGIGTHGGILLTTLMGVSHFLDSTIKTKLDNASLAKFGHSVFYTPSIIVPMSKVGSPNESANGTVDIYKVICGLGLIPPDMKCEWIQIDERRSAILVSGPTSREADFKSDVLPSLTTLIRSLEKVGFPQS